MSQPFPIDEIKVARNNNLEDASNILDDSGVGHFVEVYFEYPDEINEKTKNIQFFRENRISPKDKISKYMKEIKPDKYTQSKKLICDWTDKEKNLVQYRKLEFFVRHCLKVEKIHELPLCKQSKWLEKYISFNTQKKNLAKKDFEKDFYKLLKNSFYGKTMENVRIGVKI